jgi:hypothetical protein
MLLYLRTGKQFLCLCVLFNDTVSSSDYIALNDNVINEQWIWKDMEGSGHGLVYGSILGFV